ncbi:MAG: hypothetical protein AAGJ35_08690, partial [Myxococcota bacterium]
MMYKRYNIELKHELFTPRAQEIGILMRKADDDFLAKRWFFDFHTPRKEVFSQLRPVLKPLVPSFGEKVRWLEDTGLGPLYTQRSLENVDIRFLDGMEHLLSSHCLWCVRAYFSLFGDPIDG